MGTLCGNILQRVLDAKSKVIDNIRSFHTETEANKEYEGFIDGVVKIASIIDKTVIESAAKSSEMFSDSNKLIKSLTDDRYENMSDFLKSSGPDEKQFVVKRLDTFVQTVTGLWRDPGKVLDTSNFNTDAKNLYKYYIKYNKRALGNIWDPRNWGANAVFKIGGRRMEYMFNRGAAFKMYKPVNDAYIESSSIINSIHKYSEIGRKHFVDLIDKHAKGTLTEEIINTMARYLDPSQSMPDIKEGMDKATIDNVITEKIKQQLENDHFDYISGDNQDKIVADITARLRAFQQDYNILNYGVKDPYYYDGSDTVNKITKKKLLNDDSLNRTVEIDGEYYPPILKMMLVSGARLHKLAEPLDNRDANINEMRALFNPANGDDEGFRLRMNYFPSSGENDNFGQLGTTASTLHVNTDLFQARTKLYDDESTYSLTELQTNNFKALKYYFSTMPKSVGAKRMDYEVKRDDIVLKNNPELYSAITHYSENIIKNESSTKAPMTDNVRLLKKTAVAAAGFVASGILMLSAPVNIAAGYMTGSSRKSLFDQIGIRKEFKQALNSTGINGKVARMIDEKYRIYNPLDRISDMVQKESVDNFDNGIKSAMGILKGSIDYGLNKVTGLNDAMVNKVFGVIKPMNDMMKIATFGGSEDHVMGIVKGLHYEVVKEGLEMIKTKHHVDNETGEISRANEAQILEDVKKLMNDTTDRAFIHAKEMGGEFNTMAKPLWMHQTLSNATTAGGVAVGLAAVMHGMFKQVFSVNMDVVNRSLATLEYSGLTGKGSKINAEFRPSSVSGATGLVLLALYNFLTDNEEYSEMIGLPIPKSFLLASIDPTGEAQMAVNALYGGVMGFMNGHVTGNQAKSIVGSLSYIGGPVLGSGFRDLAFSEQFERTNVKMDEILKEFALEYGVGINAAKVAINDWDLDFYDYKDNLNQEIYALNPLLKSHDMVKFIKFAALELKSGKDAFDNFGKVDKNEYKVNTEQMMDTATKMLQTITNTHFRFPKTPFAKDWDDQDALRKAKYSSEHLDKLVYKLNQEKQFKKEKFYRDQQYAQARAIRQIQDQISTTPYQGENDGQ